MKAFLVFIVCMILLVNMVWVLTCSAQDETTKENDIAKLVSDASKAYGKDYENLRDEIIKRGNEARPILEKLRKDESWDIRMTAYFLLGWIENEKVYRKLLSDRGGLMRSGVVTFIDWRLGDFYGEKILPFLIETIVKDKENYSRYRYEIQTKGIKPQDQSKREWTARHLQVLLRIADKAIVSDVVSLPTNQRLKTFLLYTIECHANVSYIIGGGGLDPSPWVPARNRELTKKLSSAPKIIEIILQGLTLKQLQEVIKEEKDENNKVTLYLASYLKGDNEALINLLKTVPDFKLSEAKLKALKVLGETAKEDFIPNLEEFNKQTTDEELKKVISGAIERIKIRVQAEKDKKKEKIQENPEEKEKKEEPKKEEPK